MDSRPLAFSFHKYSDVPLYNIQAVAAATGVPPITLRSWERRYGVPEPKRDVKGYRLYSERDIAVARWLKERVDRGVGISRAVNMLRVLEIEQPQIEAATPFDLSGLRGRLIEAVRSFDDAQVSQIMQEALMVASMEDVCLVLLQPALYEIGHMWANGTLSVTAEHVASNMVRSFIAQLVRLSPPALRPDVVVVGCAPGELHDIGPLMLTLFMRRRGFDVLYVGASVEEESVIADIQRLKPTAVCLSATGDDAVESLSRLYRRLRQEFTGLLAFGGRAFNERPELIEHVPGEYLGADAGVALSALEAALAS